MNARSLIVGRTYEVRWGDLVVTAVLESKRDGTSTQGFRSGLVTKYSVRFTHSGEVKTLTHGKSFLTEVGSPSLPRRYEKVRRVKKPVPIEVGYDTDDEDTVLDIVSAEVLDDEPLPPRLLCPYCSEFHDEEDLTLVVCCLSVGR